MLLVLFLLSHFIAVAITCKKIRVHHGSVKSPIIPASSSDDAVCIGDFGNDPLTLLTKTAHANDDVFRG